MIFIALLNSIISLIALSWIKRGVIIKYTYILRCVNVVQLVLLLFIPLSGVFLMIDLFTPPPIIENGRALGLWITLIYALLGILVFIFNVVILLINRCSKNKN